MDNIRQLAGGDEPADWTGFSNVNELDQWVETIFETAKASTVLLPHVVRYDSPRTVHVPYTARTTSEWATGVTDVTSSGTTQYDVNYKTLTPVKYRTMMPVSRATLGECTWSAEADIKKRLAHRCALKLDKICWAGFDDAALDSDGDYQAAGSALSTGTNVNVGTALSVDNIVDGIDGILQNNYVANTIILRAEHHADLLKESTFINAAEHGDASVIKTGKIANFLGCDVMVSENIPEDSSDYTLSFVFDDSASAVANIPNEFELESHLYWRTDVVEFCAGLKGVAAQLETGASAVLYGSA
jgi:hypothetical protein